MNFYHLHITTCSPLPTPITPTLLLIHPPLLFSLVEDDAWAIKEVKNPIPLPPPLLKSF